MRGNVRTLSHSGSQVIILGQMCPPAILPSEAGRPTTKREHMPALPSAAGPDMCYFLLARPTCAAEPFSCTTCCTRMRIERPANVVPHCSDEPGRSVRGPAGSTARTVSLSSHLDDAFLFINVISWKGSSVCGA